jgi:hypothetical protein
VLKFKSVLAPAIAAAVLAAGMSTAGADGMSYGTNTGAKPMAKANIVDTAQRLHRVNCGLTNGDSFSIV